MSNWWGLLKKPQKQSKPGAVDGKVKLPKLAGAGDIDSVIDEHEATAAAEAEAERQAYREAVDEERAEERAQRHEEESMGSFCGC